MRQLGSSVPTLADKPAQAASELDFKALESRAIDYYQRSLDATTRNENTAQYRALARTLAYRLLDLQPRYPGALNLLGRLALDEGFYESAETHLREAIASDEHDVSNWYSLGHLMLATRRFEQALASFSRALELAPDHQGAASALTLTLARLGRMLEAFNSYRQLIKLHPTDAHIRGQLTEVARYIQADHYHPELEQDLIDWLCDDQLDHAGLARLCASLLTRKYQLNDADAQIDLQDLCRDRLLSLSLRRFYFTDASLESFLLLVRKQLLLDSLAGQFQDRALLTLAADIAMQAAHNEYVYDYDADEGNLVTALKDLIESSIDQAQSTPPVVDLADSLLLYAMYESPADLSGSQTLANLQLGLWPEATRATIEHCLIAPWQERWTAQCIKSITPISDHTSQQVREQYEQSPYPRWLHLGYNTPTHYGRALEAELENFRAPQSFNIGTIKVLIAGAGTGRHALRVAKYFRNVEVTAIDLSARSLAYAERMAQHHGLHNLRFLQADILELDRLDERFHLIECSGVLHHMQDPEAGLAALIRRLEDDGLIKLGLYSEQGRQPVLEARGLIERLGYQPTVDDIRRFRSHLLAGRLEGSHQALLNSADFYSTSGCRDLLFHVQEHRFDPRQIETLLSHHQLEFLGFVLPASTKATFQQRFGSQAMTDLDKWADFEVQHPTAFANMYQCYVRLKKTP